MEAPVIPISIWFLSVYRLHSCYQNTLIPNPAHSRRKNKLRGKKKKKSLFVVVAKILPAPLCNNPGSGLLRLRERFSPARNYAPRSEWSARAVPVLVSNYRRCPALAAALARRGSAAAGASLAEQIGAGAHK